jgi:hypothetical protein
MIFGFVGYADALHKWGGEPSLDECRGASEKYCGAEMPIETWILVSPATRICQEYFGRRRMLASSTSSFGFVQEFAVILLVTTCLILIVARIYARKGI